MNGLDIAILVIALSLGLIGFMAGIVRIVVTIVGMAVGIFLSGRLNEPVSGILANWMAPDTAHLAAFGVVFALTLIASFIISTVVKKLLSLLLLGWVDKVGGMALAVFVGMMAMSVLLTLLTRFPVGGVDKTIQTSLFGKLLVDNFKLLVVLLPPNLASAAK